MNNKLCEDVEWLRKFRPTEYCAILESLCLRPAHQDQEGWWGRTVGMSFIYRPCVLVSSLYTKKGKTGTRENLLLFLVKKNPDFGGIQRPVLSLPLAHHIKLGESLKEHFHFPLGK